MVAIKDALIIGGGIGGLTLAGSLQRVGIQTRIIESGKRSDRLGTGISLLGNALRALDRVGMADICIEAGAGFDTVTNLNGAGDVLASFDAPRTFRPDRPGAFGVMRPVLGDLLEDFAVTGGATIDYSTTVAGIDQTQGGARVTLSTGEVAPTDLVVAADGAYSKTRLAVFGDEFRPAYSGQGGWRYTTRRPENMNGLVLYRAADGAMLGGIPLSATQCYYFLLENQAQAPRMPADQLGALFKQRLASFTAPELVAAAEAIDQDSSISFRPYDILLMPAPWHKGRVVLIGDAAHALVPQLTSGGGMAIEDAVVLAEELSTASDASEALERYSARRAPRVGPIYETSLGICRSEQDPATDKSLSMQLLQKGHQLLAGAF